MVKINLGCGRKYLKGYINTDNNKAIKADKYFDLEEFPYPFPNNYADEILIDNVLEHLDNIFFTMKELHRILKPKGILELYLPYAKSDGALQDPTHKHFFTEKSMNYFAENYEFGYYTDFKFRIMKVKLYNANKTKKSKLRHLIPFKPILRYFLLNMYDGIYFKLKALKKR